MNEIQDQHKKFKTLFKGKTIFNFIEKHDELFKLLNDVRYSCAYDVLIDDGSLFGVSGEKYVELYSDGFYFSSLDLYKFYLMLAK